MVATARFGAYHSELRDERAPVSCKRGHFGGDRSEYHGRVSAARGGGDQFAGAGERGGGLRQASYRTGGQTLKLRVGSSVTSAQVSYVLLPAARNDYTRRSRERH